MNPWWAKQEWPCVCQENDRWLHTHYDHSPHPCARCTECKEYRPRIPEHVGIRILLGPEMTNEEACRILMGRRRILSERPGKRMSEPCICCPVQVRGLYAVAFNLLSLRNDPDRWNRKIQERLDELEQAVKALTPFMDKHFEGSQHATEPALELARSPILS